MFNALSAAWNSLKKSGAPTKHVILFADAADAEEPGDYAALLEEMQRAHATVSVIGLGSERDTDAELLKAIAARGQGRIFFVSNALEVPAVFAQETVAVSRSTFVADAVGLSVLPGWREFAAREFSWPAAVDGYNLNYPRNGAAVGVVSTDEYRSPLFAFWQRGAGRTAAVSFPLAGEYSTAVRGWKHYADFVHTMLRWVKRAPMPAGVMPRYKRVGNSLQIDLFYDNSWEARLAAGGAGLSVAYGMDGAAKRVPWERAGPGHFKSTVALRGGEVLRGVMQLGEFSLPFGPVSGSVEAEWSFDRERLTELRELVRLSGGVERLDLGAVWDAPRRVQDFSLRATLLYLFLGVFLLEALLTRLNRQLSLPQLELGSLRERVSDLRRALSRRRTTAPKAAHPAPAQAAPETPEVTPERKKIDRTKELFRRAKRRGM